MDTIRKYVKIVSALLLSAAGVIINTLLWTNLLPGSPEVTALRTSQISVHNLFGNTLYIITIALSVLWLAILFLSLTGRAIPIKPKWHRRLWFFLGLVTLWASRHAVFSEITQSIMIWVLLSGIVSLLYFMYLKLMDMYSKDSQSERVAT